MVTTIDVEGTERFVRVMVTTMAWAKRYDQEWPKYSLETLALIRREFTSQLMKGLARPFEELEETKPWCQVEGLSGERGIVITTSWSMSQLVPGQHLICIRRKDREFVMINRSNGTVRVGDRLLARVIGPPEYPGNMHLFINSCAYAVESLFRARFEELRLMQEDCMLRCMYGVFDAGKFLRTAGLIGDLINE